MRVAQPIVLSEDIRWKLEQQLRGRSTQARVVLRSRIVLLAAEGFQNMQIAETLHVAPRMAALWRGRFIEHGIEGLLKDAPRGRPSILRTSLNRLRRGVDYGHRRIHRRPQSKPQTLHLDREGKRHPGESDPRSDHGQ